MQLIQKDSSKTYYVKVMEHLLWEHVVKLIFWTSKGKKGSDDEGTPNSKADGKFLRHQHNHRKK